MKGPDWDGTPAARDFDCCRDGSCLSPAELAQARDEADPDVDPVDRDA